MIGKLKIHIPKPKMLALAEVIFLTKYFSNRKELQVTGYKESPWKMQFTRHIDKHPRRSSKHTFSHLNRTIRS
jgi:hypothetical protein